MHKWYSIINSFIPSTIWSPKKNCKLRNWHQHQCFIQSPFQCLYLSLPRTLHSLWSKRLVVCASKVLQLWVSQFVLGMQKLHSQRNICQIFSWFFIQTLYLSIHADTNTNSLYKYRYKHKQFIQIQIQTQTVYTNTNTNTNSLYKYKYKYKQFISYPSILLFKCF